MASRPLAILQTLWRILRKVFAKFIEDDGPLMASGLAFTILLFCIPFSLLIAMGLELAMGSSDRALEALQAILDVVLPITHEAFTENLSLALESRGLLGVVGLSMFFLMSSFIFGSARTALNTVFEVPRPSSVFKATATDVLVMLLASGLLLLMVALTSLLSLAEGLLERSPRLEAVIGPGWVFVGDVLGFLFTVVLFYILYRFCPAKTLERPALFVAAFAGAALFELSKWAYAWYVELSQNRIVVYGGVGDLFFFFVWIYYACAVLILGAEIGWGVQQTLQTSEEER